MFTVKIKGNIRSYGQSEGAWNVEQAAMEGLKRFDLAQTYTRKKPVEIEVSKDDQKTIYFRGFMNEEKYRVDRLSV